MQPFLHACTPLIKSVKNRCKTISLPLLYKTQAHSYKTLTYIESIKTRAIILYMLDVKNVRRTNNFKSSTKIKPQQFSRSAKYHSAGCAGL